MSASAETIPGKPMSVMRPRAPQEERCDLCSLTLSPRHRHLLEMARRRIVCACDACALTFQSALGGRFKLIPRDVRALPDFRLRDGAWECLGLPINLAFIFQDSRSNKRMAMYPSPAGATESLLTLDAWEALATENPTLAEMLPDVEALLVNRLGSARDYFIAPIDRCFELVGIIRTHWRGLSGGEQVWPRIEDLFEQLKAETGGESRTPEGGHA